MAISMQNLECLWGIRPDILPFYAARGHDISNKNLWLAIAIDWFNNLKVAGPATDDAYPFPTLESYLQHIGCMQAPGPGNPPAVPAPGSTDPWKRFTKWVQDNPAIAIGGAALLFLIVFRPGDIEFGGK